MTALRAAAAAAGFLAALLSAFVFRDAAGLAALVGAAFALHACVSRSLRRTLLSAAPVVAFCVPLALLQWFSGTVSFVLPLRVVAVFLLSTAAFRILPWRALIARVHPGSPGFTALLFALITRHFALVLARQAQRSFRARALAVPRRCGRGWFRSLAWALANVFGSSLARAERFYAGLWLGGWSK